MRPAIAELGRRAPQHFVRVREQRRSGYVTACVGLGIEVHGLKAGVGRFVEVMTERGPAPAQIVGFRGDATFLMPLDVLDGLEVGAEVRLTDSVRTVAPEDAIGRVINARGEPMDGGPALRPSDTTARTPAAINPLARPPIDTPLDVGVRVINALLTIGRGQRVGLFAGSGVGKSVLLGMLARFTSADVVVVGLIGERGREVQEFVVDNIGDSLSHCAVVASPADDSPALRLRGAWLATELAESYRSQGKNVLLLMDSLTRCAQAQREIGLALGEPGTTKGYPPSAFALLPRLVERAGATVDGSITAFYTVLMEEDDLQDPVVDSARSILDGHIVLDRALADAGVYPAIQVSSSVSRVMNRLCSDTEAEDAREFKALWSRFREQQDLINVGAYQAGSDAVLDRAVKLHAAQETFVKQEEFRSVSLGEARAALRSLLGPGSVPQKTADGQETL